MSETNPFTFLVEFKGGTYIAQVDAVDVNRALNFWRAEKLNEVAGLSKTKVDQFNGIVDSLFVPVDKTKNVWCLTATIDGEFFLMNVVATAKS